MTWRNGTKKEFFDLACAIDNTWAEAEAFFHRHAELVDLYLAFRNDHITREGMREGVRQFCMGNKEEIEQIPDGPLRTLPSILLKEMDTNLFRKMSRMKVLEQQKHLLPEADLRDNIETAIKSAIYMDLRALYNTPSLSPVLHCALFLFIRNYAYSGMFRYNDKGQFNVPYGGIAYNAKSMRKKLDYYRSIPLLAHFRSAHIYNMDFEQFLPAARRGG